jgi:hypothetical protein
LELQGFELSERRLAEALGLPVRQLATVRTKHLKRGADWELADNDIALAEKSAPALLKLLGLTPTPAELAALLQKSRRVELPPIIEATVARFPLNPHLILVKWKNGDPAQEHTANLVVTKRDNFKPGMEVPIRLNTAGKYELARRTPRQKGRW